MEFKISFAFVNSQTPGFSSTINFLTILSSIIITYLLDLLPMPKPEQSKVIPNASVTCPLPSARNKKSSFNDLLSLQTFETN